MRRLLLIWVLILSACGGPMAPTEIPTNDSQMIRDAVIAEIRQQGNTVPVNVEIHAQQPNWALAILTINYPDRTEQQWTLLEKSTDAEWTVAAIKDAFSAEELAAVGFPESAWPDVLAEQVLAPTTTRQPVEPATNVPATPPANTPAPPPSVVTGPPATITGQLLYPSDITPSLNVYVVNIDQPELFYMLVTQEGQRDYTMSGVQPGRYYVTAFLPRPAIFGGGYTAAVPCGLTAECTDHRMLEVVVEPGSTVEDVSPVDWYAPIEAIPTPMPGKPQPTVSP